MVKLTLCVSTPIFLENETLLQGPYCNLESFLKCAEDFRFVRKYIWQPTYTY